MLPWGQLEYLEAGDPCETSEDSTAGLQRSNGMPTIPGHFEVCGLCRVRKLSNCSFTCFFFIL